MHHREIELKEKMQEAQLSELVWGDCKIIGEIGINHRGDLSVAKKLIEKAKFSGCWGIKFQFRDLQSFYHSIDEVSDVIIHDELVKNNLTVENLKELAECARKLCIKFGVSVFRVEDLNQLREIEDLFDFFKVPSAECLNNTLIEALISKSKPVFVSTGGVSTQVALDNLRPYVGKIIPFHCIANYPSKLGGQDLNVIDAFFHSGFGEVGYSSHDEDWEVCLIAISKGVNWIERHITLDKSADGLDNSSSSLPFEIEKLVNFAKNYRDIVGIKYREPNQGELINLQNLGTSMYAKKDMLIGEKTKLTDFVIKAPRTGLSVGEYLRDFQNQTLKKKLFRATSLGNHHFNNEEIKISDKTRTFANLIKLGLPVRLHDYLNFKNLFGLKTHEFHLSFSEVINGDFDAVLTHIDGDENVSIHLPDYIPGNRLLDPLAGDKEIRNESRKIINKVLCWGKRIEEKISKPVNIIGSFSCTHNSLRIDNLDQIFEYLTSKAPNILPQWLPVYAWYFGGNVKLDLFNSLDDIEYITRNNLKICLDVSHLVMAASYFSADWKIWYKKLSNSADHLHISDASDVSSEGLMIGDGLIGNFSEILALKSNKIIECWQGHMNGGEGFKKSLEILKEQYSSRDGFNG